MTSYFTVEQTQKMEAAAKRIAEKPVMETITYETDSQVASVRKMLADGIEMYGAPEALNILVTDILTSLIAHIDDQDANIKAAIAVGRYAAAGTSIDPIIQWMVQHGWLDAGNEYTTADLVSALTDNGAAEGAGSSTAYTCPKCSSHAVPHIVSGMGLRATCACGFSGGDHEFTASAEGR